MATTHPAPRRPALVGLLAALALALPAPTHATPRLASAPYGPPTELQPALQPWTDQVAAALVGTTDLRPARELLHNWADHDTKARLLLALADQLSTSDSPLDTGVSALFLFFFVTSRGYGYAPARTLAVTANALLRDAAETAADPDERLRARAFLLILRFFTDRVRLLRSEPAEAPAATPTREQADADALAEFATLGLARLGPGLPELLLASLHTALGNVPLACQHLRAALTSFPSLTRDWLVQLDAFWPLADHAEYQAILRDPRLYAP